MTMNKGHMKQYLVYAAANGGNLPYHEIDRIISKGLIDADYVRAALRRIKVAVQGRTINSEPTAEDVDKMIHSGRCRIRSGALWNLRKTHNATVNKHTRMVFIPAKVAVDKLDNKDVTNAT